MRGCLEGRAGGSAVGVDSMLSGVWYWLVIGAFAIHGVGMIGAAGYLPFDKKGGFIGTSWLLGSGGLATAIGVIVWAAAGIAYVAAAYGLWRDLDWWQSLALVGAIATLLAIALWFGKVPGGVYVGGALGVATIVLVALV